MIRTLVRYTTITVIVEVDQNYRVYLMNLIIYFYLFDCHRKRSRSTNITEQ